MLEIEQIEEESNLHSIITEAHRLRYMLEARLDEARCARDWMAVDLGYISHSASNLQSIDVEERECENANPEENSGINTETNSESSTPSNTTVGENIAQAVPQTTCRSVKPPQVSLPKFHGGAEEFPDYWAIFETLAHNSPDLAVMEKILLLKESLVGKAPNPIKDMTLISDNYNWIIETLPKNNLNQPTNRAQIVQKLINMKPAANTAESCSTVFDNIQVHQMISAGHDVRRTCEPIWYEIILAKFPRDIVKPVLINGQSKDQQTIEDLMAQLKGEISAVLYVDCSLGHANKPIGANNVDHPRPQYSDKCIFCHRNNHSSLMDNDNGSRKLPNDPKRREKVLEVLFSKS
uniref:Integrase catalytic domain-containing protein n=1 Tax=Haemonchus contortus TaxID=6289 RepID=A0A7I4Z2P9_HAECO